MKKRVIFDCDNTMGIVGKDVDDGLTLIYLLGREDIEVVGVTLTYGNSNLEDVRKATDKLVSVLGLDDLNVYWEEKAHKFLVEESAKGELSILATGSMTNLYEAYKYDNEFYKGLDIYIMGGIVEPLIINNREVRELNLASNSEAAYNVLSSNANISILNGHTTANAVFGLEEIERLRAREGKVYRYIEESIGHWIERIKELFGIDGFCNWDMAAAIYISHTELFSSDRVRIEPNKESLKIGDLNLDRRGSKEVNMPSEILDMERFNKIVFKAFERFNNIYN